MSSDAILIDWISRIVGYKIRKGNFQTTSPNLPMRIAVLAEANAANQSGLITTPYILNSENEAAVRYGAGSPIHIISRILLPKIGGGVSGIPVVIYPQAEAAGATAKVMEIVPVGTATSSGTHTIVVAGREGIDGASYAINIVVGDTPAIINGKIVTALSAVLGCPVIVTTDSTKVTATTKWKGLTADGLTLSVNTNNNSLGITYTVNSVTAGAGTPSVQAALDLFGSNWNTLVVNSYGTVTSVMTALENFNGIPDPSNPTGRFLGNIMKPFVALTGSVADDPTSITDARSTQVTIALCPTPLSPGFAMEGAANYAVNEARTAHNTPHLDIGGQALPDMPTPLTIGSMANATTRNTFVKKGCSTVDLVDGKYVVQDFVTTYHPAGENPPQFRYVRNLVVDMNVYFGYYLLEQKHVIDHVIARDEDVVSAEKVIKPKQWIQIISTYSLDLVNRALTVDAVFMQKSLQAGLSTVNPDRLETFFRYKRSGVVRIASTDAEAGFNYGS